MSSSRPPPSATCKSGPSGINPRLAFLPLMYFGEIRRAFVQDYREVIDGVVVAYPQDRDEIDQAWAILNDAAMVLPGELSLPVGAPPRSRATSSGPANRPQSCRAGANASASASGTTSLAPTAGYHFKQLLVNGAVVWEEDVAGGTNAWREVTVDVTAAAQGKTNLTIAFRLLDKKGVSNFGVRWQVKDLQAEGLRLAAGLDQPAEVAGVPARGL